MGQTGVCSFESTIARGISIKKEIYEEIKPKINPLKYINPLNISFDEPDDYQQSWQQQILPPPITKTLKKGDRIRSVSENQEQNSAGSPSLQNNLSIRSEQKIIKKVAVTWDKFIKMKQKKFTDDYQIIEEIGRGGFGAVYKVFMKGSENNTFRAAKKIMKESLKKDEHENLLAEMAIMMSLDHPNITKLYQVYEQKHYYVMVMELCEGGELFQKIAKHEIKEKEARNIISQILSALHYMHSLGIVHRDIKPENMLFQKKTKLVKLIDFGISTRINPGQYLSSRVGTPYYIAPEVLIKKYNTKCDIWSLGVVLYMMIFKKPPFRGNDSIQVMQNVINEEPSFANFRSTKYSLTALNFLHGLLKKNTEQRLDTKSALAHQWLEKKKKFAKNFSQDSKKEALQRMTKFHFKNKLQAVVHTYIVSQLLTSEERLELLDLFHELDIDQNGVVDKQQLQKSLIMKKIPSVSEDRLQKILDYIDTNCSGMIDYTQFLVSAINFQEKVTEKHFEQAFEYFDIDKSGEITYDQVAQYLAGQNSEINEEQIKQLFRLVDKNGDGVISKQEFVELLVSKQYSQP